MRAVFGQEQAQTQSLFPKSARGFRIRTGSNSKAWSIFGDSLFTEKALEKPLLAGPRRIGRLPVRLERPRRRAVERDGVAADPRDHPAEPHGDLIAHMVRECPRAAPRNPTADPAVVAELDARAALSYRLA